MFEDSWKPLQVRTIYCIRDASASFFCEKDDACVTWKGKAMTADNLFPQPIEYKKYILQGGIEMGITRYVGSVKGIEHFYVELFFNQKEEIIGRGFYRKDTFERLVDEEVPFLILRKLRNVKKSDLSLIRGEKFQRHIEARNIVKKEIKESWTEPDFVYGDVLYNQELYVVTHSEEMIAKIIFGTREKNDLKVTFFEEEELTYPDVIHFLRSSMKMGKVSFFLDVERGIEDGILACLKTNDNFYMAQLINASEIKTLRVFDKNHKEIPLKEIDNTKMIDKIQLGIMQRNAKMFLKSNELVI